MRVGLGYDIHRLTPGRALILGGVSIDHEKGLDGHSDADVVLHALMDALLGAAALGDIGEHFPPGDARFRDASSLRLLETVRGLVTAAGFSIVNVDVVVVADAPHLSTYKERMRCAIANALGVKASAVGLKATTNEGVGPEGRLEAISARAVALLDRKG